MAVKGVTIVNMVEEIKSHSVCQSVLCCFTQTLLCITACICVCTRSVLSSLIPRDETDEYWKCFAVTTAMNQPLISKYSTPRCESIQSLCI